MSSPEVAHSAIDANTVTVSGAIADKPSRQVRPGEPIEILAPRPRYVGRAGLKLEFALDEFDIDVSNKRCLDVGASTGGFTDCLLQRGASIVYAVDVGHGQLHSRLRSDARVVVRERTNARSMTLELVDDRNVDIAVADLAFISLRLVNPAVMGVIEHDGDVIYLIKPQFEAPKDQVGKGGIVSDPQVWQSVLTRLLGLFSAQNLYMIGVVASPIRGASGNVEFLAHLRKDSPACRVTPDDVTEVVAQAKSRQSP